MSARTANKEARRAQFVAAAAEAFAEQGVAKTTISDIATRAGLAHGTFYLYFESKEDVAGAVFEAMAEAVVEHIETTVPNPQMRAIEKLLAMGDALATLADEPHEHEMIEAFHRAENMGEHDRLMRSITERLIPVVAEVIAQGIEEGVFDVADSRLAASFVVGAFVGIDFGGVAADEFDRALEALTDFILGGLGARR